MTRVIFMGTPDFAVPPLRALIAAPDFDVVAVVTQPDRPAGRGNKLQMPPIKAAALAADLPVMQPEKLRDPGVFEALQRLAPDLIVVAAYGQILRQKVLDLPRYGCINVHASLLPRWRGAAPIQACIRAGDPETGITIMQMDAGLDTGPMLGKRAIPIEPGETGASLHDKLAVIGGELLLEVLRPYLRGDLVLEKQDDSLHTYAPMLSKEDGRLDWSRPAAEIARWVRAYHAWPGTYTTWEGQILKILADGAADTETVLPGQAAPGEVVAVGGRLAIGTGEKLYAPRLLQLAGRSAVTAAAFLNGHPAIVGAVLG